MELGRPHGLPDNGDFNYLVETLFHAGPTVFSPDGEAPLEWQDIAAFVRCTHAIDEPWEHQALRTMSRAYMAAREAGKEPLAMAPVDQDGADSGD